MPLRKFCTPVKFNNFSASPTEVTQKEKRTSRKTSPYKDQREGINDELFP